MDKNKFRAGGRGGEERGGRRREGCDLSEVLLSRDSWLPGGGKIQPNNTIAKVL